MRKFSARCRGGFRLADAASAILAP